MGHETLNLKFELEFYSSKGILETVSNLLDHCLLIAVTSHFENGQNM